MSVVAWESRKIGLCVNLFLFFTTTSVVLVVLSSCLWIPTRHQQLLSVPSLVMFEEPQSLWCLFCDDNCSFTIFTTWRVSPSRHRHSGLSGKELMVITSAFSGILWGIGGDFGNEYQRMMVRMGKLLLIKRPMRKSSGQFRVSKNF